MPELRDKHVVIFGCGYLGAVVATRALARGASVTALTRNPAQAEQLRPLGIAEVVVADFAGSAWHREIGAADFAVNCVGSGGGGLESYRSSYLGGMASLLQWAGNLPQPLGAVVFTSSTSVYPQGGGIVVDETCPTEGAPANGVIMAEAEKLLLDAPPAGVKRAFVLRLAGIYGPGRHLLLDQIRAGEPIASGNHHLNLIHRDDAADAVLACLESPAAAKGGVFNVCDGAPLPRLEVARWIARELGLPPPRVDDAAPSRSGRNVPDRVISNRRLRESLGWRPGYPDCQAGYAPLMRRVD